MKDSESQCSCPFPEVLSKEVLRFELKKNSRFDGINSRADREFLKDDVRRVIFHGTSEACAKCIACVEVFKKVYTKTKLYQWNICKYSTSKDVWAPITDKKLERLVVEKNVPALFIMVSKDPFPDEFKCESQQSSDEALPSFLGRLQKAAPSSESEPCERNFPRKTPYQRFKNTELFEAESSGTQKTPNKWKRPPKPTQQQRVALQAKKCDKQEKQ